MAELQHPLSRAGIKSEICQINIDESVPELEQRAFPPPLNKYIELLIHCLILREKPTSSDGYALAFLSYLRN